MRRFAIQEGRRPAPWRGLLAALSALAIGAGAARAQGVAEPSPMAPSGLVLQPGVGQAAPYQVVVDEPTAPPPGVVYAKPKVVMDFADVVHESIFGEASKEDWAPLSIHTFFSEGWDTPFSKAPNGTNGAPKQNWIGAPAGVFGRFVDTGFFYTNHLNNVNGLFLNPSFPFMPVHMPTVGNQYAGYSVALLPLNARMEVLIGTVFIASNKSSPAGGYTGNWGDTGVQARFHLVEQRDFSLVAAVGERIPTGKSVNGNDINYVTPGIEFWWNFAEKWVLRGGTSINILTGRPSATTVLVNQLSVGRYLTGKDAKVFKDLVLHVNATMLDDVAGGAGYVDDLYIQPGFRFGLGEKGNWGVLGGVLVPVVGPQPYAYQLQFSLTRSF